MWLQGILHATYFGSYAIIVLQHGSHLTACVRLECFYTNEHNKDNFVTEVLCKLLRKTLISFHLKRENISKLHSSLSSSGEAGLIMTMKRFSLHWRQRNYMSFLNVLELKIHPQMNISVVFNRRILKWICEFPRKTHERTQNDECRWGILSYKVIGRFARLIVL